jgi:hypothetical protein
VTPSSVAPDGLARLKRARFRKKTFRRVHFSNNDYKKAKIKKICHSPSTASCYPSWVAMEREGRPREERSKEDKNEERGDTNERIRRGDNMNERRERDISALLHAPRLSVNISVITRERARRFGF